MNFSTLKFQTGPCLHSGRFEKPKLERKEEKKLTHSP